MQNRKNNIPKADSSTSRPAASNEKPSEAKQKTPLNKTGNINKPASKGASSSTAGAQKAPAKRGRKGRVVEDDPFADLNYGWEADENEGTGRSGGRGRSFGDEAEDTDDSYGGYGSSYDDDDDSRESFRRG